ncbi:hypothetical protein [Streptomyces lydicus]|uniref:hypothetical protein n=1 Tax=Streptomyces lydicus TaxID=47763 RepID=UPI00343EC0BF
MASGVVRSVVGLYQPERLAQFLADPVTLRVEVVVAVLGAADFVDCTVIDDAQGVEVHSGFLTVPVAVRRCPLRLCEDARQELLAAAEDSGDAYGPGGEQRRVLPQLLQFVDEGSHVDIAQSVQPFDYALP